MPSLKDLLLQYDFQVLKALAREHGLDSKESTKAALAQLLVAKFARREHVESTLKRLNNAEREILTILQRVGGQVAVGALERYLEQKKIVQASRPPSNPWEHRTRKGDPNYKGKPTLEDAAAHLLSIGLVLSREADSQNPNHQVLGWELGKYLTIPEEFRAFLPPLDDHEEVPAKPTRVEPGSARNFQRDMSRYISFVRRAGKLELTTQGWVYKKTLVELGKALGWPEPKKLDEKNNPYLYYLRRMLTSLELLQPDSRFGMAYSESSIFIAGKDTGFWSRPPGERVKATFEAYLDTTHWNELRIPKANYGQEHRRPAPAQLAQARRLVVEYVKRRGASGWVNLADLVDDIRLGDYGFLFSRDARSPYGYSAGYYGTPYYYSNNIFGISFDGVKDEAQGWDVVEAAIIRHILTGPLHWLGLIDTGFEKADTAPSVYRLTAMGAWLIGLGAPVTISDAGGRVVMQPNFQVVAMEPIAESVLMTLDEFAQFEGGDHALTYHLTRESVYRGQRAGWDAPRIIAYLEEATHMPLPQNVRRSLEEWQTSHERITFHRGITLLQAEDASVLDQMFKHPELSAKVGRRAGSEIALPDITARALGNALGEAGWLPLLNRRDKTEAPASMAADSEGNVEFVHRTPSIYAYGGIEPFAERVDARHARITQASVKAAVQQKIPVPKILERLSSVHRGEVPPKLIQRIKAWGNYFGAAHLGTMTLVEFRDEQARAELLADEELKPYLVRFDAGTRPLALVQGHPAEIQRVRELLAERGVEIREFGK